MSFFDLICDLSNPSWPDILTQYLPTQYTKLWGYLSTSWQANIVSDITAVLIQVYGETDLCEKTMRTGSHEHCEKLIAALWYVYYPIN